VFTLTRLRLPIVVIGAIAFAALLAFAAFSSTADADHSWNKYHWARTANPFKIDLGDNVSPVSWENGTKSYDWDTHLDLTAGSTKDGSGALVEDGHNDWDKPADSTITASDMLTPNIINRNSTKDPVQCSPTNGRVEVCNAYYGNTGWLGVASVWVRGSHIYQGRAKNNDTYFATDKYNTDAWRNLVMCQEVAHTFGLGHQDENHNNANLGSCMDYTGDPDGTRTNDDGTDPWGTKDNQYPNGHDYTQLENIYKHLDSSSTLKYSSTTSQSPSAVNNIRDRGPVDWGRSVHKSADGRVELFERDFGNGGRLLTLVIWADEEAGHSH